MAISGNSTNANTWANTPEVYDPTANTWTELTKVSTSQIKEEEYPFSYLQPNGERVHDRPLRGPSFELNVANQTWTAVGGASGITNGSSIMYRPGKILYSGGAPSVINTTSSVANTAIIDLTAATPQMAADRADAQQPHLPHADDARQREVLAVGGEATSDQEIVTSGVLPTEIWNPATEKWSAAAPIAAARNYHSTAMLMAERQGARRRRRTPQRARRSRASSPRRSTRPPTCSTARARRSPRRPPPRRTTRASPSPRPNASSIGSVNLVSLGADTHQSDMAQHFVPLSFTANSGSLTVQTPANSAIAPYGNYMLFIVNKKGVPSVSTPLNLSRYAVGPGGPERRERDRRRRLRHRDVDGALAGNEPDHQLYRHALHRQHRPDRHHVNGSPPATSATITGLKNGTTYTFTVTATNAVGSGPASEKSNAVTPSAPTAPAAPAAPTATPGNASATVTWSAPADNGSPITSYTVTPYLGTTAQPATTISGSPPATSATITGLTNGATYTFTVTATNAVGSGPASAASNAVTPSGTASPQFVQQASGHAHSVTSLAVTPGASLVSGNRLVVEVGVWSSAKATASSVKDSAGDTFTELLHFKASDGTEMSIWSAPVTAGGGTIPTITATPSAKADVGVAVLEYSGLSTAAGTAVVDQSADATGTTKAAAVVSTPATAPTTAPGELIVGFYADSGFDDNLMARMGFNGRVNVSPDEEMEFVAEDALTGATGCHAERKRADRSLHHLADGRDRLQVRGRQRTAGGATRRAGAPGRDARQRRRDRHLDRAAQRRQPDHHLHRHAVPGTTRAALDDRLGHECRDRRSEERRQLPLQSGSPQPARRRAEVSTDTQDQAFALCHVGVLVHAVLDGAQRLRLDPLEL